MNPQLEDTMSVPTPAAAATKPRASKIRMVGTLPQTLPQTAKTPNVFNNIKSSGNVLRFTLAPTHVTYANSLRRTIKAMVETVAFNADIEEGTGRTTDVKILKNSTPMSNEMLAHRLSLLPIYIAEPLKWNSAEYVFKLNVKNETKDSKDVCAGDIEVYRLVAGEEPARLPSKDFFPPHSITKETALLAVLKAKVGTAAPEEIQCEMRATLGIGKQHARFEPISQCSYQYTLDEDPVRVKEVFETWLQNHKKVVPSELEADATRKADLTREFNTMERQRCYLQTEDAEPYSFDFVVETLGPLSTTYIVGRALELLRDRCTKYASIQVGDLPPNLKVVQTEKAMRGYTFTFEGEDHTLGNLFQTWISDNLMDTNEVTFVGYKPTHPLEDQIVIDIGIENEASQLITAKTAIAKAAKACADMFASWRSAWA